jgi:hypothetical protein
MALKLILILVLAWCGATQAQNDPGGRPRYNDVDEPVNQPELELDPPAFPRTTDDLREIYVSPTATNRFLIDAATLAVGADQIVRYSLVVETSGGARNITHEGMHCKDKKWRIYATGRQDGTWSKARISEWRAIENKPVNRHHAALSRDYFCPGGLPIATADEGREALRRGRHPNAS